MLKYLALGGAAYFVYTQDFIRAAHFNYIVGGLVFTVLIIFFLLKNGNTRA